MYVVLHNQDQVDFWKTDLKKISFSQISTVLSRRLSKNNIDYIYILML